MPADWTGRTKPAPTPGPLGTRVNPTGTATLILAPTGATSTAVPTLSATAPYPTPFGRLSYADTGGTRFVATTDDKLNIQENGVAIANGFDIDTLDVDGSFFDWVCYSDANGRNCHLSPGVGAVTTSTQIQTSNLPTSLAGNDIDKCFGWFCLQYDTTTGMAQFNKGVFGAIGPTGDMIRFGSGTGKFHLGQSAPDTFRITMNQTMIDASDDAAMNGSGIKLRPLTVDIEYCIAGFGCFAGASFNQAALALGANIDLTMNGQGARTVKSSGQIDPDTAGNSLSIIGSDAGPSAADKAGGDLILGPGQSTGTGKGKIQLQVAKAATQSNSEVNARATTFWIDGGAGIDPAPHIEAEDAHPPTVGTCGTAATITTGSTDTAGEIAVGTSVGTRCAVNFASAWSNAPFCVFQWSNDPGAGRFWVTSTTADVVVHSSTTLPAGIKWRWMCIGRQ